MIWEEILKDVLPLLECTQLAECMLVCKQWRDAAQDDYLWKCLCSKRWPSICKRQSPTTLTYYKLFQTFYKRKYKALHPPKLTFDDLEFYVDIWVEEKLIFSDVLPGPSLRKIPPPEICDLLRSYSPNVELILPVEPRFTIPLCHTLRFSVFVGRKDIKKIACIINKSSFHRENRATHWALGFEECLGFSSPLCLFAGANDGWTWISLLFMKHTNEAAVDVFGIQFKFTCAAISEDEVLWILDMLDWN